MFGSCLPVCAIGFKWFDPLSLLLKSNSQAYRSSSRTAKMAWCSSLRRSCRPRSRLVGLSEPSSQSTPNQELLRDFPRDPSPLSKFEHHLTRASTTESQWEATWERIAQPLLVAAKHE
jgi:hypothetical protein